MALPSFHIWVIALVVIPLVVTALAAFMGTIAFAVVGIIVATEDNICRGVNISTGCTPATDLSLPAVTNITVLGIDLQSKIVESIEDDKSFLFWLTGATCSGLVFAILGSCCLWTAANVVYSLRLASLKEEEEIDLSKILREADPNTEIEMEGNVFSDKTPPLKENIIDRIHKGEYEVLPEHDPDGVILNLLGPQHLAALFLSILLGILSILCLMWSFAIGFNRSNRAERTVTPFVLANVLAGIIAPILLFISAFLLINLIEYYTNYKVESHVILTRFLNCLTYEEGENKDYWIIADTLLFKLPKKNKTKKPRDLLQPKNRMFFASCSPTYYTLILSIIVGLCILLSFSYFIDITLISQVTVDSCSDPSIDIHYSCFRAGTLGRVDCTSNNKTQILHCFKFYRFGIDVDLVTSTVSAFAFFLLTNRILTGIFVFLRMFRHFFKRTQGILFICGGLLLLLINLILFITWLTGHASTSVSLLSHLDILNLSQLTMVSLFVFLVGLLARKGIWIEKRPTKNMIESSKTLPEHNIRDNEV